MKGSQKVTRLKLDLEQNNDALLLGIASHEPDYKLTLAVNRKLGINLRNSTPVNTDDDTFSRFSNIESHPDPVFSLISNRGTGSILIPKLKNIDFFMNIITADAVVDLNEIVTKLREIDSVTAVLTIDLNSIKDKNIHYLTH